jgi:CheY-like chemotaxis protein
MARKRAVVLVVEDEPLVRDVAVALVGYAGYEAIEAANADEAIAILESRDDIRVVFTDINMPGSMNGLKLAAAVRDRWPPIEFIVTSALPSSPRDMPDRSLFIAKPYTHSQLASALSQLTG